MIFIAVTFTVRPEHAGTWLEQVRPFTEATRAEPGCLFFTWSRSVDDENAFVLLEAFADAEAGAAHVGSDHFKEAIAWMPDVVASTPQIISHEVPQHGWADMGEVQPR